MRNGLLIVNKPKGITSHDVVDIIRRLTGERRVGHGGTLDPLATGVLVVGVGREATKHLQIFTKGTDKSYGAKIRLGAESTTDDSEGTITEWENVIPPKRADVLRVLKKFAGRIQQQPPAYSSIKVDGVKAYQKARRGEPQNLASRSVTIHSIMLRRYHWPIIELDVACSSGTYVRALARDLGQKLRTGAYLVELERTAVGSYTLKQATTLEQLEQSFTDHLLPVPRFLSNNQSQ